MNQFLYNLRKAFSPALALLFPLMLLGLVILAGITGIEDRDAALETASERAGDGAAQGEDRAGEAQTGNDVAPETRPPAEILSEEESRESIEAFASWVGRFVDASGPERLSMSSEGLLLARQRRAEMKALIRLDPAAAIEASIPYEIRTQLPEGIVALLEKPVSGRGDYELLVECHGVKALKDPYSRFAVFGEERYEAYTYGRRLDVSTKNGISLHGIAIDDLMAVADDPVRVIPEPERVARDLDTAGVVVEINGSIYAIADEATLALVRESLKEGEFALGPRATDGYRDLRNGTIEGVSLIEAAAPVNGDGEEAGEGDGEAESPHTEGSKTMLYIRARFADQDPGFVPISDTDVNTRQAACESFWFENSYGKSSLTTTITTTVTLANTAATSSTGGLSALLADARTAALAAQPAGQDWNYANYNFYTVLTSGGSFGYGGVAFVGGTGSHLNGSGAAYVRTASHEFGHNLGLRHANYWRTDSPSEIGRDAVPGGYVGDGTGAERIEYGHKFSVMSAQNGSGDFNAGRGHYTTGEKVKLDWLVSGAGDWVSRTTSGTTRLYRHDVAQADFGTMTPGVARAIKINLNADDYTSTNDKRRYWLSYRRLPTNGVAETWLRRGLQVDWQRNTYGSDGSIMLDMTPYSNDNPSTTGSAYLQDDSDKEDAALILGRTYTDRVADIHITPIAQGGSNPNEWIDVTINIGTQSGNNDPVGTLIASGTQVNTGQTVNFTATGSDPDFDTLAYTWDFGDNSMVVGSLNSTTASKSWSAEGFYVVRMTVSDMKGGTDTRPIVIQVGNPSDRYRILGRVTQDGQVVKDAFVRIGNNYQTWTAGDGRYVLPGLPTGSHAVTASKLGLTFTPQFANPVNLTTLSAYGKDFFANESSGGTGALVLAVTPYVITVPLGASVGFTAQAWDATGNPAIASPGWAVSGGGTIDANGRFTATTVGGVFTVTATEGATVAEAFVTVANLDAIGIKAFDGLAAEGTLDPGTFRIHRYGSTAGSETVNYSVGGTAASGVDYTAPGSQANLGGGAASTDVALNPLEDGLTEGPETVVMTLASDPSYNLFEYENTATVVIADDDVSPQVTIDSPSQRGVVIPGGVGMLLEATASDDGKPGPMTSSWSVVIAPPGGNAVFENASAEDTAVTFSSGGFYVLRMSANDGDTSGAGAFAVHVGISAASNPTTTNQVIYYDLNEGAGPTAADGVGGDHPGTLAGGAGWTAASGGVSGTAASLDGIDDYISIANAPEINTGASYTRKSIAFWFKADNPNAAAKQVLFEEGGASRGLNIYLEAGTLYAGGWNGGTNGWAETFLSVPLNDTGWHHVILLLNTTAGGGVAPTGFAGILDGVGFGSGAAAEMTSHTGAVAIGGMRAASRFHDGDAADDGFYFDGLIDEFHYFNDRTLGPEIGSLYAWGNIGAVVDAGPDQPGAPSLRAALAGSSADDGRWTSPVAHAWSAVSGPGSAVFSLPDGNGIDTLGTVTAAGAYTLRLEADDSQVKTFDDVSVTLTGVPYYDVFMDAFPSITGPDRAYLANPDRDFRMNLEEYAFRGTPDLGESDDAMGFSWAIVEDGGQEYFEIRYPRRRDAALRGLTYTFEMSADLMLGAWSESGYTETGAVAINAEFEEVTVRFDTPVTGAIPRDFGRLRIEISD